MRGIVVRVTDTPPDPHTRLLVAFVRDIGLPVELAPVPEGSFLPGVMVAAGGLVVDVAALRYPGDVLHEAGHLALVEPEHRAQMGADVAPPGVDIVALEHAVLPWSYAAALHLGIDPAIVFHDGGYRGQARGLLTTFSFGVYPGLPLLEEAGLTVSPGRAAELGVAPYPHMLRWLRT
jgi:hypothetical protein